MRQVGLTYYECLDNNILDEPHDLVLITALCFQYVKDGIKRSFMAPITTFRRVIITLLIGIAVLVDRIVGQVHEEVVHVSVCWLPVGLSAEPCHAFLVDVDTQRINTVEQDVDSQVILQVVYKVWVVDVVLDYVAASSFILLGLLYRVQDVVHSSTQKYSLALGETIWLHDESLLVVLVSSLAKLISEVNIVSW